MMIDGILWSKEMAIGGATLEWQGESQLFIRLPERIDPIVNDQVIELSRLLNESPFFEESLLGYNTLALNLSYEGLLHIEAAISQVEQVLESYTDKDKSDNQSTSDAENGSYESNESTLGRLVCLPIYYGGEWGPDLDFVAENAGLSPNEVIAKHTAATYRVYMLGFSPGFPYLGGMDEVLKTPRLKVPRLKIPAGSVGIADHQTGIYPQETPGGWQIIGRCPLMLFDANNDQPAVLSAGDRIQFVAIDGTTYEALLKDRGASWDL